MSPEENLNTEDLTPTNDPPADDDGVVVAIPPAMLQVRVVPVAEVLGTKEDEDETKRLVVRYDPFMQVVNGLAGSNNGPSRRISEILHKAVDRTAVDEFARAIEQANIDGQEIGRQAAIANYAGEIASLNDQIEALKKDLNVAVESRDEFVEQLGDARDRITALEAELAESRKPPAQRAKRNDKDES